jgi:cadmium resistance protein CadD (predicted permease)
MSGCVLARNIHRTMSVDYKHVVVYFNLPSCSALTSKYHPSSTFKLLCNLMHLYHRIFLTFVYLGIGSFITNEHATIYQCCMMMISVTI